MENRDESRTVKEWVNNFLDRIGKNYTKKQVGLVIFLAVVLLMVLFLITRLGNAIINIFGYVAFIGCLISGAYMLYTRIVEGSKPAGKHARRRRNVDEHPETEEESNLDSEE